MIISFGNLKGEVIVVAFVKFILAGVPFHIPRAGAVFPARHLGQCPRGVTEPTSAFSQAVEGDSCKENWFPELIFFLGVACSNLLSKNGIFPFWFFTRSAVLSVLLRPCSNLPPHFPVFSTTPEQNSHIMQNAVS